MRRILRGMLNSSGVVCMPRSSRMRASTGKAVMLIEMPRKRVKGRPPICELAAPGLEDQHRFDHQQDEPGDDEPGADHGRPGELEVVERVEDDEREASEEETGACPAAETLAYFALTLVGAAADLAHGRVAEACVVLGAATDVGMGGDVGVRMLLRVGAACKDVAGGWLTWSEARVMNGILARDHPLVP